MSWRSGKKGVVCKIRSVSWEKCVYLRRVSSVYLLCKYCNQATKHGQSGPGRYRRMQAMQYTQITSMLKSLPAPASLAPVGVGLQAAASPSGSRTALRPPLAGGQGQSTPGRRAARGCSRCSWMPASPPAWPASWPSSPPSPVEPPERTHREHEKSNGRHEKGTAAHLARAAGCTDCFCWQLLLDLEVVGQLGCCFPRRRRVRVSQRALSLLAVQLVLGVVRLRAVAVLLLVHIEEARLVVGSLQHQHPATPAHDRLVQDGWSQRAFHLSCGSGSNFEAEPSDCFKLRVGTI